MNDTCAQLVDDGLWGRALDILKGWCGRCDGVVPMRVKQIHGGNRLWLCGHCGKLLGEAPPESRESAEQARIRARREAKEW